MKIRRLEIHGFKSFADRTVLRFGDGVTGIVGPNGCGKSNIVDAIRWVMCEQAAKQLRGSGMQDVIFAGSEQRGPMGMSEVTITFKNDGQLVPPEYQSYEEISVTRRLFRDGTSEYGINKVQCRLRDILDLFMGTGIGKNAYSIIEQGRIGLIVTSKPEDRRAFIEDAAGVSRYKARRRQAERRIEATEQNLTRVRDLTEELKKRLSTLEEQAEKARQFKSLRAELRGLELHQGAHRYLELAATQAHEARALESTRTEIGQMEADIASDEAQMQAAEADLAERKGAFRTREHELMAKQQAQALAENNAESFAREKAKLIERHAEAQAELVELEGELEGLMREADSAAEISRTLGVESQGETDSVDAKQAELDDLVALHTEARQVLEADKQELFDVLTRISEAKNAAAALESSLAELATRIERLRQASREAHERAKDARNQARDAENALAESRQLRLDVEAQHSEREASLASLTEELHVASTDLTRLKDDLADRRARLTSLTEIQRSYEGCTQAVRALMQRRQTQAEPGSAVHGLVADVVSAEPRYEAAVEAVLGDRLQYVIVDNQDAGVESIAFLQSKNEGRSTFVPLDLREDHVSWAPRRRSSRPPLSDGATTADLDAAPPALGDGSRLPSNAGPAYPAPLSPDPDPNRHPDGAAGPSQLVRVEGSSELPVPEAADSFVWVESEDELWPDLSTRGVCGKMVDLVRAQPGYEHVARVLLGDVVVVDDLQKAKELWRENGHRKTLVTLRGEVLDPVGLLTGGGTNDGSAGILAQKRKIKELTEEVRALDAKVALTHERQATLKKRVLDLESALKDLARRGHEGELSIVNLEQDLARKRQDAERDEAASRALNEEAAGLEAEREQRVNSVSERRDHIDDLSRLKEQAEQRVSASSEELAKLAQRTQSLQAELTELRVAAAARREKRDSAAQNAERIQRRIDEVQARQERIRSAMSSSSSETEELDGRIAEHRREAEALATDLSEERVELQTISEALFEEEAKLRADNEQTRAKRAEIDAKKEESGERAMRLRECEIGQANLEEQLHERYQVDIHEQLLEYHGLAPLTSAERKNVQKLRRRIDAMGPINLTAIEECQEVRERFDFLDGQRKDLEDAVESLRSAIRKINKTSKERYVEAFHLVNEKFQQVFPKLFNGGRCALVMTDESDPLESGVEIMAQPPGKKLQNVTLLSGGEKALTAVAMIFAIFLIKPTPFCLLDEVDAPLDEANVGRYNEMLREMSAISQFILITHNKRTMELPDRLYGVTMEDPGVSKLVPVDVVESDKPAASNG